MTDISNEAREAATGRLIDHMNHSHNVELVSKEEFYKALALVAISAYEQHLDDNNMVVIERGSVPPWFEDYAYVGELPGLPHQHDADRLYRLISENTTRDGSIEDACGVNGGPCSCGKHQ
jgi:hypothetical protein